MKRSTGALVVVLVAAVPRLFVLARERETILEEFVDKSDRFATTLVDHGTFGFLAGVPSAYTQPLYGWFLAAIYLPFGRSWLAVGIAQIVVAVLTALVVFEIGRRLQSTGVGLVAAIIATLHPYVVWHDVHLNREVLDGLALALLALCALMAYERRSLPWAAATGVVAGLAILGNARLVLLPVAIAIYVAWRSPLGHAVTAAALVVGMAAVVVAPWVVRNKVQVGCYAITTDSRALWKANNANTRDVLDRGGWIDDVPELPGAPPWPELAADLTLSGKPTSVDECAQMRLYRDEVVDFWRDHPGEKARLAVQATRMLWSPVPRESDESGSGAARLARKTIEPAFVIVLYVLAIAGFFVAPSRFVGLAVLMLAYNTLAAMVFAGSVRYRAPWDFLLALLAAFALASIWERVQRRRDGHYVGAGSSARA
jgi:4-amino-4-deoxy-L-arabinose transferase-like glycosyltransferase